MTTSLTAIAVGPPPAAAIMIVINWAAVGRTDLSPHMTAIAIIEIVVTTIAIYGAAVGRTNLTPPTMFSRRC